MEITFLGTRANINHRSPSHQDNAACLIHHRRTNLMIDCGTDWLGKIATVNPTAILITHAHPDHCAGLRGGAVCPVYAMQKSLHVMRSYRLQQTITIKPYKPYLIGSIQIQAIPVEHAINAPAVGYRITAGNKTIFYVPDLVFIKRPSRALAGIKLYIGDGARIRYPRVRKHNGHQMGHTSITKQLAWCKKYDVRRALFTHCGSQIVTGDDQQMRRCIQSLGNAVGVKANVAHDGMIIRI
jgi:phosphoribosyl 1,2-cyclic phosphodiesterase